MKSKHLKKYDFAVLLLQNFTNFAELIGSPVRGTSEEYLA